MEDTSVWAKRSTRDLLRALKKINCNSLDFFLTLFDTHIVPILLYAAEIWGYRNCEQIEGVHLFACKNLLHVRNKTRNGVVYGELGRYPLFITATVRFIKYWLKLLMQPDTFYSKKGYKMLFALHNRGKTTWVSVWNLCYVTMDSNKCGFLAVEMLNPLSRSWKIDCIVLSATDGVII